jgi:Mg2+/Co2+ transporter CorB
MTTVSLVLSICGLCGLLVCASVFSLLETATVAVSEHKLMSLKPQYRWANYSLLLKNKLDSVLIFSLFGNSLFNALVTTISTMLALRVLGAGHSLMLSTVTLGVTLMIIIFSEALPKVIASRSPLAALKLIAQPLYLLLRILQPLVYVIDKIIYWATYFMSYGAADYASIEELRAMIADKRACFHDKHRDILLNSLDLESLTVKEIMISWRNAEMINIAWDIVKLKAQLSNSLHTRIIVFNRLIENILGTLHTKDILPIMHALTKEQLLAAIKPINYIPDFLLITKQIAAAQKKRERVFVVINEYGDNLGLAFLDDMLEIVFDDFTTDAPHNRYLMIKESLTSYIVSGSASVREFNEKSQFQIPYNYDAVSINGVILKQFKAIPTVGICLKIDNIYFEVLQVGQFWAEKVRISRAL